MAKKNSSETKKQQLMQSKYNPRLLKELVEQGVDAQTAKKRLGLVSLQSLRTHLM